MTKKEFIKEYAQRTGESLKRAKGLIETFLTTVEETVTTGEDVQFVGWGTFKVKETKARVGRNPKTGEELQIAAKKVVKFKVGKKLADKVNGQVI